MSNGRFVSPCPPPEGWEREMLTILTEEAAEVIQRATKALRFGLEEIQPGQPLTNAQRLAHEIGDLYEVTSQLIDAGIINLSDVQQGQLMKRKQLAKFVQSQRL